MAHGAQGCLVLAHFCSLILRSSCTILVALKDPPAQSLCLLVDVPSRQHNHQGTCLKLSVHYGQGQHLRVPSIRSRRVLPEFSSTRWRCSHALRRAASCLAQARLDGLCCPHAGFSRLREGRLESGTLVQCCDAGDIRLGPVFNYFLTFLMAFEIFH